MKTILDFLNRLKKNNNREWFNAHKDEYLNVQKKFNAIVEELIQKMTVFDPSLKGLTAKDCVYRIYRDVRFSPDKSPYKRHMGAYICPGGKKSRYFGYYFHVSVEDDNFFKNHLVAVGDYQTDPRVLKILREDIINGEGDFEHIICHEIDPRFSIPEEFKLKRAPRGFSPDEPFAEYLKIKSFCVSTCVDNDFIFAHDFTDRLAELFKSSKPFLDYVNRAIDYVYNEMD